MTDRPTFDDGSALPGCAAGQWLTATQVGALCDRLDGQVRPSRMPEVQAMHGISEVAATVRSNGEAMVRGMAAGIAGASSAFTEAAVRMVSEASHAAALARMPAEDGMVEWEGVILVVGRVSADGRIVTLDLEHREQIIPVRALDDPSTPIGRVTVWMVDQRGGLVRARGLIDLTRARMLAAGEGDDGSLVFGVGADLDVAPVAMDDSTDPPGFMLHGARLRAVTVGVAPAWPECTITVHPPEETPE